MRQRAERARLDRAPPKQSSIREARLKLYLDTEFNGHGGELISMALAAETGPHWYRVAPEPHTWNGWVFEHVFPHLGQPPCTLPDMRASLSAYLHAREGCTIYADWPDDFVHLMKLMSGPSYTDSWMVGCSMVLLRESDPRPEVPHNALSDAIALMRWHQGRIVI